MAEFERIEKVSYLRIFTHNINKRKFMISCCVGYSLCMGYSLCLRRPIFKTVSFLEYLVFFFNRFFAQNKSNVSVEWFFACFWHF